LTPDRKCRNWEFSGLITEFEEFCDHHLSRRDQNHGSTTPPFYYVFDVMVVAGQDVMAMPLEARWEILRSQVLPSWPIPYASRRNTSLPDLIQSVKAQGLEGLIAKRRNSRYEPGQRSGAWRKMRVNQGQDFVIAGYMPRNFDALIFGYYDGGKLIYAARTRNGFTPASREAV
jgi:ATP-dependent DNA ligase